MTVEQAKEKLNRSITWDTADIEELVKTSLKELTEAQDSWSGYFHIMEQTIGTYKFHCDRITTAKAQLHVIEAIERGNE